LLVEILVLEIVAILKISFLVGFRNWKKACTYSVLLLYLLFFNYNYEYKYIII
jgi:hypothetical protein